MKGMGAAGSRQECAEFVEAFGPQGGVWWSEGKTYDQARRLHADALRDRLAAVEGTTARLEAELRRMLARLAGAPYA